MAVAAGVLALSGCASGFHPETSPSLQPRDGQNDPILGYTSAIAIRHAVILGPAPDATPYPKNSDAALYVDFLNQTTRPDTLLGVQTNAADKVVVSVSSKGGPSSSASPSAGRTPTGGVTKGPGGTPTPSAGNTGKARRSPSPSATQQPSAKLTIPPSSINVGAVRVGRPPYASDTITLTGLTRSLDNGAIVSVTFVFQHAGALTVDVPVMPQSGPLGSLSPAPAASSSGATG